MKKITLLILLMFSTNALAEWTIATISSDFSGSVYVDFGTIKKKGHKVKMWSLFDFTSVHTYAEDNTRYLSQMERYEYDCEEETSRQLDLYSYSGNMRQGDIVWSSRNIKDEPESIVPESIQEELFNIACGKK